MKIQKMITVDKCLILFSIFNVKIFDRFRENEEHNLININVLSFYCSIYCYVDLNS